MAIPLTDLNCRSVSRRALRTWWCGIATVVVISCIAVAMRALAQVNAEVAGIYTGFSGTSDWNVDLIEISARSSLAPVLSFFPDPLLTHRRADS
jgi:hypothetical protein